MSEVVNLKNDLNVDRKQMPQIAQADLPEFLRFLQEKGISFEQIREKAKNLKPTQKHLNADKVKNMITQNNHDILYQHFIVSKENRILDGTHRWAAVKVIDDNSDVNVIKVDLSISKLIEIGHDFDLSFSKGIREIIKLAPIAKEIISI